MADQTTSNAFNTSKPSLGDTDEFLKLVGISEPSQNNASSEEQPTQARDDVPMVSEHKDNEHQDDENVPSQADVTPSAGDDTHDLEPAADNSEVSDAIIAVAQAQVAAEYEALKPVVIKGGPRRVVRADGQAPEASHVMQPLQFALSSGHEMFMPKKHRNLILRSIFAVLAMIAVAVLFYVAIRYGLDAIRHSKQIDLVNTRGYDRALSVTPADDSGYYTVFFVTSTDTNEDQIGDLSGVVMYRTNKEGNDYLRIHVPVDLYVGPYGQNTEAHTLAYTLENSGVTAALQGICDAFGLRLYNAVVCSEAVYDELSEVMLGRSSALQADPQTLLGRVRTNLSLEGLVEWCGRVALVDPSSISDVVAPTDPVEINGASMSRGSKETYDHALKFATREYQLDEQGNYIGTQYDEAGNPILDELGNPVGALYDTNGALVFDEEGYLQFYGQQFDENGNPIGTRYDDWGNPQLDWYGNPLGTQYDENGSPQRDWRGNIVISDE